MHEWPTLTSRNVHIPSLFLPSFPLLSPQTPSEGQHLRRVPVSVSELLDTHFQLFPRQTPLDSLQEVSVWSLHYSTHYCTPTNLFLISVLSFCHQKLWSRHWLLVPQPSCPVCHLWPTGAGKYVWNSLLSIHDPRRLLCSSLDYWKSSLASWPQELSPKATLAVFPKQNGPPHTPSLKPSGPSGLYSNLVKKTEHWAILQDSISLHHLASSYSFFLDKILLFTAGGLEWCQVMTLAATLPARS